MLAGTSGLRIGFPEPPDLRSHRDSSSRIRQSASRSATTCRGTCTRVVTCHARHTRLRRRARAPRVRRSNGTYCPCWSWGRDRDSCCVLVSTLRPGKECERNGERPEQCTHDYPERNFCPTLFCDAVTRECTEHGDCDKDQWCRHGFSPDSMQGAHN